MSQYKTATTINAIKMVSFFGKPLLTLCSPHDEAAKLGVGMSPPR